MLGAAAVTLLVGPEASLPRPGQAGIVLIALLWAAGAVFASQRAYVVSLAGVALSATLLGEVHSPWAWAAPAG